MADVNPHVLITIGTFFVAIKCAENNTIENINNIPDDSYMLQVNHTIYFIGRRFVDLSFHIIISCEV